MRKTDGKSVGLLLLGLVLLAAGIILLLMIPDPQGVMRALPYVCIGLGCGLFGHRMDKVLISRTMVFALTACGSTGGASSAAGSAAASSGSSSGDVITIGTISPNTGSLATYGTAVTTAVDLAVEQINAAGGVNGSQIKIVNADDQFDPTECLNAFNSLVSQGIGLIVGSVTSGCTSAITDAADEEQVCLLTPSATADSITTKDDYVFRACYADSFQGAIAAAYAKQKGYTDVGVVYCAADTYSKGLYDSFNAACQKYGVNVKAVESTASLDVQDYTNQFSAMPLVVRVKRNFLWWIGSCVRA